MSQSLTTGEQMHKESDYLVIRSANQQSILHAWSGVDAKPLCLLGKSPIASTSQNENREWRKKDAAVFPLGYHDYCAYCLKELEE